MVRVYHRLFLTKVLTVTVLDRANFTAQIARLLQYRFVLLVPEVKLVQRVRLRDQVTTKDDVAFNQYLGLFS